MRPPPLLALVLLVPFACSGPTYTRASDDPDIDSDPLSTRLDRVDLQRALDQWYEAFRDSAFWADIPEGTRKIAILTIENETSEHIGSSLKNLIESVETKLVNDGVFAVVSNDQLLADAVVRERVRNLGDNIDDATVAALGKEWGIHYFVHGRIGDNPEKSLDRKRVQYFLFLKVTEVATTRRVFQHQVDITKQVEG